jgi:hypothetical protein
LLSVLNQQHSWRETNVDAGDRESGFGMLVAGDRKPVRAVCFNAAEGWCRDVPDLVLQFTEANRR